MTRNQFGHARPIAAAAAWPALIIRGNIRTVRRRFPGRSMSSFLGAPPNRPAARLAASMPPSRRTVWRDPVIRRQTVDRGSAAMSAGCPSAGQHSSSGGPGHGTDVFAVGRTGRPMSSPKDRTRRGRVSSCGPHRQTPCRRGDVRSGQRREARGWPAQLRIRPPRSGSHVDAP